jgi:hypothetical protein
MLRLGKAANGPVFGWGRFVWVQSNRLQGRPAEMNPSIPIRVLYRRFEIDEELALADAEGFDVLTANRHLSSLGWAHVRRVSAEVFEQMIAATTPYKSSLLFVKVERGMDAAVALRIMQDGNAEELERPMELVTISQ